MRHLHLFMAQSMINMLHWSSFSIEKKICSYVRNDVLNQVKADVWYWPEVKSFAVVISCFSNRERTERFTRLKNRRHSINIPQSVQNMQKLHHHMKVVWWKTRNLNIIFGHLNTINCVFITFEIFCNRHYSVLLVAYAAFTCARKCDNSHFNLEVASGLSYIKSIY